MPVPLRVMVTVTVPLGCSARAARPAAFSPAAGAGPLGRTVTRIRGAVPTSIVAGMSRWQDVRTPDV